jgi:hypothetical protein
MLKSRQSSTCKEMGECSGHGYNNSLFPDGDCLLKCSNASRPLKIFLLSHHVVEEVLFPKYPRFRADPS